MSDQHVPTPTDPARTDAGSTKPAAVGLGASPLDAQASKPAKSKGMSIYNCVTSILLIVFLAVTITMAVLTQQRASATRNTREEARSVREQAAQLAAPRWCEQVTAEHADAMEELYDQYYDASTTVRVAIDKQCAKRVNAVKLIHANPAGGSFDTETNSCSISESGTTASCTVEVKANDTLRAKLATFSSTTVTLKMWFDHRKMFVANPDKEIENVATVTLDSTGMATVDFEVPYDSSWGEYYGLGVSSFFPNE